jgi:hypothetical protein
MASLADLEKRILADGSIDDAEVAILRNEIYADGKIDRAEIELLTNLRTKAKTVCAAFETFFFEALTTNILSDGNLDAEEATWLRKTLFADGQIDAREKAFLGGLLAKAKSVSPEFQKLVDDCMKS